MGMGKRAQLLSIELNELSESLGILVTSARIQKHRPREFPCGLLVRILGFHCPGSVRGQGPEILQVSQCDQTQTQNPTDLMATF